MALFSAAFNRIGRPLIKAVSLITDRLRMRKKGWIDVSVTVRSGMVRWPGDPQVSVDRTKNMNKGDMNNLSFISMGSHTGTHMDAPLHFFANGKGLEKMPFTATIGPARVLEIRDKQCIRAEEIKAYKIKPGERILFKTRNSTYWKNDAFYEEFVYIAPDAAEYLASLPVTVIGIDYLSVDGYKDDGDRTHKALLSAGIWIIEGLNLAKVEPGNYELICLPIKILNSDGAPARAIIRSVIS